MSSNIAEHVKNNPLIPEMLGSQTYKLGIKWGGPEKPAAGASQAWEGATPLRDLDRAFPGGMSVRGPGEDAVAATGFCHPQMYNFTSFTVSLNELQTGMEKVLAPTDCRLRPDIRSMENGNMGACLSTGEVGWPPGGKQEEHCGLSRANRR